MILSSKGKTLIVEERVKPAKLQLEEDVSLVLASPLNVKAKKDIEIEFKFGADEDVKIIKVETDNDYEEIEISKDLNQESFNKEIAAKKEAKEIVKEIESLGDISLEDKDKIESIRNRYNKLSSKHKELVNNLAKLEQAEAKIEKLEEAKKEKERQDSIVKQTLEEISNADDLDALEKIEIDSTLSEENKFKIEKAKLDKKVELDKEIANNVIESINSIKELESLTLDSKESIEKVREAYNKLSEDQKVYVNNLDKLEKAESKIKELEEAKKEKERQDKIVKDTLEKINEANSLDSLGSVVVSKDISKARQEKLLQAKEDKRKELELVIVSNIELQLKEVNTLEKLKSIKIPNGLSKETSTTITELVRERKIELLKSEHIKVLEEVKSKYPEKNYTKYNKNQYNEILDKIINLDNLEQLDQVRSKVEESLSQIKTDREIDIEKSIDNYKSTYNDLLSKNKDNLILADKLYIEKALSEYDNLDKEVKEALASSKGKLDEFCNKIKYIENQLVKSLKLSIEQAETVESLENIIVDENLSKENKEVINRLIKDKKEALLKEEERQDNVVNEFKVKVDNEKELDILKQIEIPKNIDRDRQDSLETYKNLKVKELENAILSGLKKEIEEANNLDELNDIKLPKGLEKANENEILDLINSKEIELFKSEKEKELLSLKEEYPKDNYKYSKSDYNLALEQLENLESIEDLDETVSKVKEMLSKLKTDQEKIDEEVSLFKEKHSKILAYEYNEITLKEEDIINNFLNDYNNLSDVIKDRLLEEKNLVNKYSKRIEELKFIEKKNEKKSEIEKKYPAANYTKKENKNLYDNIVNRVDKFSSYQELEKGVKEILAELAEVYTNKDLEEIEKIENHFNSHMKKTLKAANKVGKNKNIVQYDYNFKTGYYHVMINKNRNDLSGFKLAGTSLATGLLNFLTTANKGNKDAHEQLSFVKVVDLNRENSSKEYSREDLNSASSHFLGALNCINYFIPKDKPIILGSTIGENFRLEYNYRLSSGKSYIRYGEVYFSNDYPF